MKRSVRLFLAPAALGGLAAVSYGCDSSLDGACQWDSLCSADAAVNSPADSSSVADAGLDAVGSDGADARPGVLAAGPDAGTTVGTDAGTFEVDGARDSQSESATPPDAAGDVGVTVEASVDAGADVASADATDGGSLSTLAPMTLIGRLFVDATALYGTTATGGHAIALGVPSGETLASSATSIGGLWAMGTSTVVGAPSSGDPLYSFDKGTLFATTLLDIGPTDGFTAAAMSSSSLWVWQFAPAALPWLSMYVLPSSGPPQSPSNTSLLSVGCASLTGDGIGVVYAIALGSTDMPGPCTLFAVSAAGGNKLALASPTGAIPTTMVLDQGSVYWYNSSPLAHEPMQLAVDSSNVYWTDSAAGTVESVPITASVATATIVAMGQNIPAGIAVDSTAIYWATASSVMRLAK